VAASNNVSRRGAAELAALPLRKIETVRIFTFEIILNPIHRQVPTRR
jgi:hypothetical protein